MMSNVGTHGDRKFTTPHRMSVDESHGDPKFTTPHRMSVDESHNIC